MTRKSLIEPKNKDRIGLWPSINVCRVGLGPKILDELGLSSRNIGIDGTILCKYWKKCWYWWQFGKKKKIIKMDYIYMILEESLIKDNIVYNTCIKLVTIKLWPVKLVCIWEGAALGLLEKGGNGLPTIVPNQAFGMSLVILINDL